MISPPSRSESVGVFLWCLGEFFLAFPIHALASPLPVAIYPTRFEFTASPGQHLSGTLEFWNGSEMSLPIEMETQNVNGQALCAMQPAKSGSGEPRQPVRQSRKTEVACSAGEVQPRRDWITQSTPCPAQRQAHPEARFPDSVLCPAQREVQLERRLNSQAREQSDKKQAGAAGQVGCAVPA